MGREVIVSSEHCDGHKSGAIREQDRRERISTVFALRIQTSVALPGPNYVFHTMYVAF